MGFGFIITLFSLFRVIIKRYDFKEAYQRAQRIFNDEQFAKPDDLEGVPFPKLFEEVEGKLVRTKAQPTVRQLDYIKRGLDDNIKSKSRTGGLGNQERASSSQILGMFRDTIDESVPQYGAARKKFGDDLDVEESYEAGKGLLKVNKSADAVRNEFSQLSEPVFGQVERIDHGLCRDVFDAFERWGES